VSAILSRDKLAAVLGMLGSDHDGEALAAARMAERIRRRMGVQWDDLLISLPAGMGRPADGRAHSYRRPDPPWSHDWRTMVSDCVRQPDLLTKWEAHFVQSVAEQRSVSRKQWAILAKIAAKVRV
jgi:hypothetical protein